MRHNCPEIIRFCLNHMPVLISMSNGEFEKAEQASVSHDEPDDLQYIVHHAKLPQTKFSRFVDGILNQIGSLISWFWLLLMAVIIINVVIEKPVR